MATRKQIDEGRPEIVGMGAGVCDTQLAKLPAERRSALEILLSGKSVPETAEAMGISRRTVYRWLREDPVFQAAYNQWQEEMRESCRAKLLTVADKAAEAVRKAVEEGDARLGFQMLKEMGMLTPGRRRLTDPADVALAADVQRRRVKADLDKEEFLVGMGWSGARRDGGGDGEKGKDSDEGAGG